MSDKVFIFAGRATQNLARRVADIYGIPLGNSTVFQYADGEFQPSYEETIRGGIVFIIQSTTPPTDNLFELLMMIDAAKRASARQIVAVIPYYGFARQDRKDKPHVPIASRLIADMITAAGVDRVITMDLHADQIQGFFTLPVDHLYGSSLFTSLGDGLTSALIAFLRTIIFEAAALLILPEIIGSDGIWFAIGFAEVLATILTIIFICAKQKKFFKNIK